MRCCIASSTTSRLKDHNSALTPLPPPAGQPSPASRNPAHDGPRPPEALRDHAHTLSYFLVPTLSIECEPCGRFGRYNVAKLIEQYGDAKLPDLRHILANCQKAHAASMIGCKADLVSLADLAGQLCARCEIPNR